MKRSIVPTGFSFTAHPVFRNFNSMFTVQQQIACCLPAEPTVGIDEFSKKCSICLQPCSNPVTIVSCTHSFCADCIHLWFAVKIECPLCKASGVEILQYKEPNQNQSNRTTLFLWRVHLPEQDRAASTDVLENAVAAHNRKFLTIPDASRLLAVEESSKNSLANSLCGSSPEPNLDIVTPGLAEGNAVLRTENILAIVDQALLDLEAELAGLDG